MANWVADVKFLQTKCDEIVPKSYCSIGFLNFWHESKAKAMEGIRAAVAAHPDYDFIVTGHSLGGAAAVYATIELRKQFGVKNVTMVNSPHSKAQQQYTHRFPIVHIRPTPRGRRNPNPLHNRPRPKLPRNPHL